MCNIRFSTHVICHHYGNALYNYKHHRCRHRISPTPLPRLARSFLIHRRPPPPPKNAAYIKRLCQSKKCSGLCYPLPPHLFAAPHAQTKTLISNNCNQPCSKKRTRVINAQRFSLGDQKKTDQPANQPTSQPTNQPTRHPHPSTSTSTSTTQTHMPTMKAPRSFPNESERLQISKKPKSIHTLSKEHQYPHARTRTPHTTLRLHPAERAVLVHYCVGFVLGLKLCAGLVRWVVLIECFWGRREGIHLQASVSPPNSQQRVQQTSIIVLVPLMAKITAFSSSNATLHTASAGLESSLTNVPVLRSHTLTLPSLPPLTMRVSSNCSEVTLLSCAASRCTHAFFSKLQTLTDPSEPPVTSVFPRICSCPTSEVWP